MASRRVLTASPGGERFLPARIDMCDTRIETVTTASSEAEYEALAADATHDFGDKPITPAFINGHTHLALVFLRGVSAPQDGTGNLVEDLFFHYESRLSAADVAVFSRLGAYESLLNGVGLVWDHYYFGEAVADACTEVGLAAVVAPTLQDLSGPGMRQWERNLEVTAELASEAGSRGVWAAVGPHATDTVSSDLMERALSLAETRALPVHLHVAQSLEEVQRVRAREGTSPMNFLRRAGLFDRAPTAVLAHGLFATKEELALLQHGRHALAVCPASQAQFGFPIRVDWLDAAAVPWLLATDCAASNDAMGLQKELRWCAAMPSWSASCEAALERMWGAESASAVNPQEERERVWKTRQEALAASPSLSDSQRLLETVWAAPGALHPGMAPGGPSAAGPQGDSQTPGATAASSTAMVGTVSPGALANLLLWDADHPALFPCADPFRAIAFGESSPAIVGMWVRGQQIGAVGAFASSLTHSDGYRETVKEARERLASLLKP